MNRKKTVRMSLPGGGWDKENNDSTNLPPRSRASLSITSSNKIRTVVESHKTNTRHSMAPTSSRLSLGGVDKRRKSVSFAEATDVRLYAKNADSNHTLDLDKQLLNDHNGQRQQQQQTLQPQYKEDTQEQTSQLQEKEEQTVTEISSTFSSFEAEEKVSEKIFAPSPSPSASPSSVRDSSSFSDVSFSDDIARDEIEQAVEMEMTRVFGTIYDRSEELTNVDGEESQDEDLSMEMTGLVGAGILSAISPARIFIRRSIGGRASVEPIENDEPEEETRMDEEREKAAQVKTELSQDPSPVPFNTINPDVEESVSSVRIPLAGEAEMQEDATMELTRCFGSILPTVIPRIRLSNSNASLVTEQSEMEMDMEMTGLIPPSHPVPATIEKEKIESSLPSPSEAANAEISLPSDPLASPISSAVAAPFRRRISQRLSLTLHQSKNSTKSKRSSFQPISPDAQLSQPCPTPILEEESSIEKEKDTTDSSLVFSSRSSFSSVLGDETAMLGAKWAAIIGVGDSGAPSAARSTFGRPTVNLTAAISGENANTGALAAPAGMSDATCMIDEMFKRVLIGGESPGRALQDIKTKFKAKLPLPDHNGEEEEVDQTGETHYIEEKSFSNEQEEQEEEEETQAVEKVETKEEFQMSAELKTVRMNDESPAPSVSMVDPAGRSRVLSSPAPVATAIKSENDDEQEITFSFVNRDSSLNPVDLNESDGEDEFEADEGAERVSAPLPETTMDLGVDITSTTMSLPAPSVSRMATFLSAVGLSALDDEAVNGQALRRNRRDSSFAPSIPSSQRDSTESESALPSIYALTTCSEIEDYQSACLHLIESNASMKDAMSDLQETLDSNPPPIIQFFLQPKNEPESPAHIKQRQALTDSLSLLHQRCVSESKLVWAEWRLQVLSCCQASFLRHLTAIEGDDATISEMKQMLQTLKDEATKREDAGMRETRRQIIQARKEKDIALEKRAQLIRERDARLSELNTATSTCTALASEAERLSAALVNRAVSFNRLLAVVDVAPYFHHLTGLQPLIVTSNQLKLAIHSLFSLDIQFQQSQPEQQGEGIINPAPQLDLLALLTRTNIIDSASLSFPFVLSSFHDHCRQSLLSVLSSYQNSAKRSVHRLVIFLSQRLGRLIEWTKRIVEMSKKFTIHFSKPSKAPITPTSADFPSPPFSFRVIISSSRISLQVILELSVDLTCSSIDSKGVSLTRIRVISEDRSNEEDELTRSVVMEQMQRSDGPLHHILEQIQHRLDK